MVETNLSDLQKRLGPSVVQPFTEIDFPIVGTISTGSLRLDRAIGGPRNNQLKGIPRGRITMLWGDKGSGKSTLLLHIIAEAQKQGLTAALIDLERTFDPEYAQRIGVGLDSLLFVRGYDEKTGVDLPQEDIWEIVEALVRSQKVGLIGIDSVDQMIPRAELEGELGESYPGLNARINGQAMRKLTGAIHRHNVAVVTVNQVRYKIGITFGDPRIERGGQAYRHAVSLRINCTPRKSPDKGGESIAQRVNCRIPLGWNKIAPSYGGAENILMGENGIDILDDLLTIAEDTGAVEKRGSYYYHNNENIAQGRNNAKQFLKEHPQLVAEIEEQVREYYAGGANDGET